ncbi:hypothetical protein [Streptomyces sp. TLI_105]|uniref:hypothetical protein n=1 Tax=Streptomyces sp. TLI_105 TaxID=1881019 RepID=UPI00089C34F0|nr:hypothetical protein [Streptomyces sp. TLI_105]SED49111.1 hypothetical protein SAMN05428939_5345 [Streptomyces sp. TLI_105]
MSDSEFDLPPHAPPEVVAEWNDLADRVCRELARAGLPARRSDLDGGPSGPSGAAGAEVHVDRLAEGGVFVDWQTDAELRATALGLFAEGIDYANPPAAVRHYNSVHKLMRDALLGILASAGFQVEEPDRHTYGSAVYVKGLRP